MSDRIGFGQVQALVNARPGQGTRRALHAALNGINETERTIRAKIAILRAALDDTGTQLDASLHTDGDLIQRADRPRPGRCDQADPLEHRRHAAHRGRTRRARHHRRPPQPVTEAGQQPRAEDSEQHHQQEQPR